MKVYVLSDLHAEFEPFVPPSLDVDLVVLAGDINKKTRGIEWASDTFSCDVVYVMGNHEYYTGHFDRTLDKARKAAAIRVHRSVIGVAGFRALREALTTQRSSLPSARRLLGDP